MKNTKIILILSIVFLINNDSLYAQKAADLPSRPFRQITFESFLTPGPLDDYLDPQTGMTKTFWEFTFNGSVYTNLNKHFLFGLSYSHLWTRFNQKTLGKFFIAGLMGRYNYALTDKINIYGDVGYHVGNYCSCLNDVRNSTEFPFKREDMRYLSLGLGANIQLYKSLWLKVGGMGFLWLNNADNVYYYGHNLPTIGLQLNFK